MIWQSDGTSCRCPTGQSWCTWPLVCALWSTRPTPPTTQHSSLTTTHVRHHRIIPPIGAQGMNFAKHSFRHYGIIKCHIPTTCMWTVNTPHTKTDAMDYIMILKTNPGHSNRYRIKVILATLVTIHSQICTRTHLHQNFCTITHLHQNTFTPEVI